MTTIDCSRTDERSADDWASAVSRSLNEQRASLRSFLQRQRERFAERQACLAVEAGALAPENSTKGQSAGTDLTAVIDKLVTEVEQLRVEMGHPGQAARSEVTESHDRSGSDAPDRQYEDLRRRFEMAVEDLRDSKVRNAELEEQLQQRGPAGAAPRPAKAGASNAGDGLDWESQKRRLMAELEEFDDKDEEEQRERLSIDGAIRITDQVVADKEKQIAELKEQLEQAGDRQSSAAAQNEFVDQDEAVRAEREKLKGLQQDWTNKLRKAEIEISVERAKMARERAEMQEQIVSYKAQLAEHACQEPSAGAAATPKKTGGRKWLSRLGLTDDD